MKQLWGLYELYSPNSIKRVTRDHIGDYYRGFKGRY